MGPRGVAPGMRAVVFDVDGVILRSMESHAEAYRRTLAPLGISFDDAAVFEREGARSETILADLLSDAGESPARHDITELARQKQALFAAMDPPQPYPGAAALLKAVWDLGVPTAVVTGTRRTNLDALMPDWVGRFDAVLTQEDYTHDKPHPEPYARAATALGIPAGSCVAVENAVRGVRSARSAGYGAVVGLTTTMPPQALLAAGADPALGGHGAVTEAVLGMLARGQPEGTT